ncbi:hypothetical protein [Flavobacterium rhizosphaerae]|uniref:LVIVD repeat-containing protein n=1 Tax=Flavobacterium rhizosphaerae TaxID=3163298 RepID=A0ABW8YS81_9FLAO
MKKRLRFLALMPLFVLASCIGNSDDAISPKYEAVIMKRQAFENSVSLMPQQTIAKAGKLYIKGNLLFVNDVNKGFQVYQYDNDGTPQPLQFINVPGATDLSMRGNTIYINQATDLITLAYVNNNITLIKRNKNVFPQKQAPNGSYGTISGDEVIVDWQQL